MKSAYRKKPDKSIKAAHVWIDSLFKEAQESFKVSPELCNRYVSLAWKIAMKFKVRLPHETKSRICRHCLSYLVPGVNSRTRLTNKKIVTYCMNCKRYTRRPYKK